MKLTMTIASAMILSAAVACAQSTLPSPGPAAAPAAPGPGAAAEGSTASTPLSPAARGVLTTLQDRKKTLKDFTANVDYSVEHVSTDVDGSLGTVDYVDTPAGPEFSIAFVKDTLNGKTTHMHERHIIYDTKNLTTIDYQAKQYNQAPVSTSAGSLESEVPIPIGVKVDDVTHNFNVVERPSTDPNEATLRLTPLVKGKFNYSQLDVTVDKKLEIPVKIVVYGTHGDVTTIKFTDIAINTGKAKMLDSKPPTGLEWTIHLPLAASAPAATAPAALPGPPAPPR